ncbi:Uncharacterized protein TCAP_06958 [Tolypocladium capitatum]|uniref:AB hydrolase-1 domain-containing protein n=1 Tax=Tolypocladium capitatum TaxID=45235 RepID=A0A2K3Q6G7_9HYPO|nr:Uncharacterized protein TCAP_06958 [Tolypocladium capitatum]
MAPVVECNHQTHALSILAFAFCILHSAAGRPRCGNETRIASLRRDAAASTGPMIGTSRAEWILIRLSIVLFRRTPLLYGTLLLGITLLRRDAPWYAAAAAALCGLLVAEALFYGLVYVPYTRRLSRAAVHPEPLSPQQRRALFERCIANVPSHDAYLRWWFLGADVADIRRDNVREFLLWAFFDMHEDEARASDGREAIAGELNEYLAVVEERLGRPLGHGRGTAKCLRLTLDGVNTAYRSLAWYAVVFVVDQVTHWAMLWHGFQYYARSPAATLETFPPRPQELLARLRSPVPGLGYWYHPHRADGELPVVFFHGIGIGLWTYVRFVAEMHAAKTRGVIALELLPVSFRLTAPPPSKAEFLQQMTRILDHHHDWDSFTVVSHSYGSVLTTHVLGSPVLGRRVPSVALVDPVTIMLHLPDVAYNFTRRHPRRANEWQLWYFASTDPGVAHCLGRHFFWRENIIWKEELLSKRGQDGARKAAVCLSGRDLIVDTAAVAEYLDVPEGGGTVDGHGERVETLMFPHLDHAQVFDSPADRKRIVALIKSYCSI